MSFLTFSSSFLCHFFLEHLWNVYRTPLIYPIRATFSQFFYDFNSSFHWLVFRYNIFQIYFIFYFVLCRSLWKHASRFNWPMFRAFLQSSSWKCSSPCSRQFFLWLNHHSALCALFSHYLEENFSWLTLLFWKHIKVITKRRF